MNPRPSLGAKKARKAAVSVGKCPGYLIESNQAVFEPCLVITNLPRGLSAKRIRRIISSMENIEGAPRYLALRANITIKGAERVLAALGLTPTPKRGRAGR